MAIELRIVQFWSEMNLRCALVRFWNHAYDFRPMKPRLCFVRLQSTQEVVEHERSVGENTRRSRVFFPTFWVLYRFISALQQNRAQSRLLYYRGQPKAGTGHKMLFVPFVFSKSRFQGPASRCDKIVVIVTVLEAIEGIPDNVYNFWGNEKFHNLCERLVHERKLKSGYLERRIYERPLHLQSEHISKLSLHQSLVKRKFIHCDF